MSKRKTTPDEILETAAIIHSATTAILLALTKTLEEAGVMRAEHFEANVRMLAERTAREKSAPMAEVMLDFADQLSREEPEGSA